MKKRLVAFLISIVILAGASVVGVSAAGATESDVQALFDALVSDGGLDSESTGGDWLAIALALDGQTHRLSDYAALVAHRVKSGVADSDRLRTALVCAALHIEDEFVKNAVGDAELDQITEVIWRLVLAVDLKMSDRIDPIADLLTSLELEGGGFALSGKVADPDVTAMAACALHFAGRDVAPLIELLSGLQTEDGHFSSYGNKNAESAAQVVIALRVCGIDPKTDPRFVINGTSPYDAMLSYAADGGFSHLAGGRANLHTSSQIALALLCESKLGARIYSFSTLEPVTPSNKAPLQEDTENSQFNYKPIACAAILVIALIAVIILAAARRLNAKNATRVGCFAAVALAFVMFTTIQTPEQFYSENPDPITADSETVTLSVIGLDGEILISPTVFAIRDGEDHLDLLVRAARYSGLRADTAGGYVRGIGDLYEFDHGGLSGWTVRINGTLISSGADSVPVRHGDRVEWVYETDGAAYGGGNK